MSALFTPFRVDALELRNRIVIAPMRQYSAVDGCMINWHVIHLGHLALSGALPLRISMLGWS
jgi:2,4-dienoyl-CoA reductase-like NADH-dependent reductase (Old Yellow Enzyme family)